MVFPKYLRYHHHFRAIFKPHKPYFNPTNLTSLASPHSTSLYSPLFSRTFSLSAQFAHKTCTKSTESDNAKETDNKAKKSLGVLFKEAAGLSKMPQQRDSDSESGNEATELRKKLRELEKEIRVLKGNKLKETENNNEKKGDNLLKKNNKPEDGVSISKNNKCSKPTPVSLSALFSKKPADSDRNANELMRKGQKPVSLSKKPADSGGNANELMRKGKEPVSLSKKPADSCANANQLMRKGEKPNSLSKKPADQSEIGSKRIRHAEPIVYKELPGNMVEFARVLYQQGYLKDANFLPQDKFDATAFENNYARNFLKHAARRFGKDHQEIAKWLSGSELKKVALFGCPSFSRKTLFSAKLLRTFFKIPEDTVCSKCALKQSCSYVNQRVWGKNNNNLDLPGVMDILTLYAMGSVPSELVVPEEIKASVTLLLEEVVKLSKTGS